MKADISTTRIGMAEHAYPPANRRIEANARREAYWANPANNGSRTVATEVVRYRVINGKPRRVEAGKVHKQHADTRKTVDIKAQAANHVDVDSWASKH